MRFLYTTSLLALAGLLAAPTAHAQRVEAIGLAASFNVGQNWVREPGIQLGSYTLQTRPRSTRIDDTGNRYSAYARIGLGQGAYFAQPELAYTSVLSSKYDLSYPGDPGPASAPDYEGPNTAPFGYRIRRAEVAALAGRHLGSHFYVLAGPILAMQQRPRMDDATSAVYRSLYGAVEPVQLLGQVGVGAQVWHLDFSLRYEHSLTSYSRQVTYQGQTQGYHQGTSQLILSLGVLLYHPSQH